MILRGHLYKLVEQGLPIMRRKMQEQFSYSVPLSCTFL